MYTRAFVKTLILPTSISVGVVRAEGKENECDNARKLVRPRDLALYTEPPKCVTCSNTVESDGGFLLTTIRCARQELQSVLEQAKVIQAEAVSLLDGFKKETSEAVSYLQQEENLLPRMGAIGVGAFAGYILAIRKGILKRMLYSAAGAGAIAAIAYPNEAREISGEVVCELKKYAVIGYHFVNGADVDWKKLNEEIRCLRKSRITGGIDGRARGKSGEVIQPPADAKIQGEDIKGLSQTETEGANETTKDESSSESITKPSNSLYGQGNASDTQASIGKQCEEPFFPQERPKERERLMPYRSHMQECKARRSACAKRQLSDPNGRQNSQPTRSGSSPFDPYDDGKSGGAGEQQRANQYSDGSQSRYNCSPDSQGDTTAEMELGGDPTVGGATRRSDLGEPRGRTSDAQQPKTPGVPDEQGLCILDESNNKEQLSTPASTLPDSNQSPVVPSGGPRTTQQPQMPAGVPSRSASGTCSVPDERARKPGSRDTNEFVNRQLPQSKPYRGITDADGSGQRPPERPGRTPEMFSGQQRTPSASQGPCRMSPPSYSGRDDPQDPSPYGPPLNNGPTPQGRAQSPPVHERRSPQSRSSASLVGEDDHPQSSYDNCKDGYCMKRLKPKPVFFEWR